MVAAAVRVLHAGNILVNGFLVQVAPVVHQVDDGSLEQLKIMCCVGNWVLNSYLLAEFLLLSFQLSLPSSFVLSVFLGSRCCRTGSTSEGLLGSSLR
jgi:hypothetical protein